MGERIKKLRKELGLTQKEFGERIGIKANTVATYEIGRNNPIDAVISLICREFNVSEAWLRTGEGEMRVQKEEDPVTRLCAELHATILDEEIIRAYFRIDERVREPFMTEILRELRRSPASSDPKDPGVEALAQQAAQLTREQAVSEKGPDTPASSASGSGAG